MEPDDLARLLPDLIAEALRDRDLKRPDPAHGLVTKTTGVVESTEGNTAQVQLVEDTPGVLTAVQLASAVSVGDQVVVLFGPNGSAHIVGSGSAQAAAPSTATSAAHLYLATGAPLQSIASGTFNTLISWASAGVTVDQVGADLTLNADNLHVDVNVSGIYAVSAWLRGDTGAIGGAVDQYATGELAMGTADQQASGIDRNLGAGIVSHRALGFTLYAVAGSQIAVSFGTSAYAVNISAGLWAQRVV